MALVLSPWFGWGCGRRFTSRCGIGSPALFTDLVIVKVPLHRQSSNARVVQWAETPEAHIFTLRLPGLRKKDVHIELEDDRVLYISYQQPKDEKDTAAASTSGSKEETFKRKFKLPENVDLEQGKAEVANETLTVTVPKAKSLPPRKVGVSDDPEATLSTSTKLT